MWEPDFATDLYDSTAAAYDRFRLPYPPALATYLRGASVCQTVGYAYDLARKPPA